MKVPPPSQTRDSRVKCLVSIARYFLGVGVPSHLLVDRLEQASFRLWPTLGSKTRREYVTAALRTVLSRPPAETVLPEAVEPPQEGAAQ